MKAADLEIDYLDCANKCLKFADQEGVDQAEVFISNTRALSANIEKGSIKSAREIYDHGISIRVTRAGSIGFSFSTDFEWDTLEKMVKTAIKLSKTGIPDPHFRAFPSPTSYPSVSGIFDPRIAQVEVERAMDYCLRTASGAEIDKRIDAINVDFGCGIIQDSLLNTNGIEISAEGTAIHINIEITAKEEEETSSGYEFQASRFLTEINPELLGQTAAEMALKSLHAKTIETGTYPVVLHPFATASIFSSGIGAATNAESIQYNRSYLTGLREQSIGSDLVNVVDNGLYMKKSGIAGLGTASFDGEGVARQKTVLISNGTLKEYLYDSYCAGKEERLSTGNAIRPSYRSTPMIGISNLEIQGQAGNLESFISEVKEGILLIFTWDRPTITTGDFSGQISLGFKIENGILAYPLKNTMFGINLLDFYKRIYAVGNDYREVYNVIAPSICVSEVRIAGAN